MKIGQVNAVSDHTGFIKGKTGDLTEAFGMPVADGDEVIQVFDNAFVTQAIIYILIKRISCPKDLLFTWHTE